MTRHRTRKHITRKHRTRKHSTRKYRRSRNMRGGSYTDGASYGMYVNGTTGSQWSRTMDQAGPYGQVPGNTLIGAQGQNVTPTSQMPTSNNLNLIQSGAGRRRRRGGFIGEVINQAIVPLSLLGMQQSYGRRKRGGKTLRKKKGGNPDPTFSNKVEWNQEQEPSYGEPDMTEQTTMTEEK